MSTRIIIQNLPHNITAQRLKTHFSSQSGQTTFFSGQVTDAKLVTDTKTGKSRGFAFVGYRNSEQADTAVDFFNGTYIDQQKISVQIAKPVTSFNLGCDNGRLGISR
jgi:multiple RNA-binding domain-containing protein 1